MVELITSSLFFDNFNLARNLNGRLQRIRGFTNLKKIIPLSSNKILI